MTDPALTITRDEAAPLPPASPNKITLKGMVKQINSSFESASKADTVALDARINAGKLLLEAKARVDAAKKEHGTFAVWCAANIKRSMPDIYRVMKLASSPDSAAAREEEKRKAKEAMAAKRASDKAIADAAKEAAKQSTDGVLTLAAIEGSKPEPLKSVWDNANGGVPASAKRDAAVEEHASRYKATGYELAKVVEADIMLLDGSVTWTSISKTRRDEIASRLKKLVARLEGME
jgi:hypothetical protein